MQTIKTINEIKEILQNCGKKIALVPTMGALHQGHLALIAEARKIAEIVVVSIFVNQKQFNDSSDYKKYPRTLEEDLAMLAVNKVDYVFAPDHNEIYPQELSFKINVTKFHDCLCGKARLGHFDGVALVLTKLFNIINPDFAFFGKKDFQQFLIVKNLVQDFNFNVKIAGVETVREKTGLALSSRNSRLDKVSKIKAANIFCALQEISSEVRQGKNIPQILQNKQQKLLDLGFEKIDYLEIRDEEKLELVHNFDPAKNLRIFIALYLQKVRLIDNLKI